MVSAAGKILLILSLTAIACSTPPETRALKDAKMYRRHGQYEHAIQAYERALSVDTACTEALAGKGLCQIELENLDGARATYEKLGLLHPDNEESFFRLGQIDLAQGKYDQAVEHLRRALSLNGRLADSHFQLGLAYGSLKKYDEAVAEFSAAINLNAKYVDAWLNMGNALTHQKKYERALESYSRVLKEKPDNLMALYMSGDTLYALGRYLEAEAMFERALKVNSGFTAANAALEKCRDKLAGNN